MSKAVFREHIEQIRNRKDASAIARFIAPTYRGFDAAELNAGIEGYKHHFKTITTWGRPTALRRGGSWRRPAPAPSATSRPRASACASRAPRSPGSVTASLSRSTRTRTRSGCCSRSAAPPGPSRSRPCSFEVAHGVSPDRLHGYGSRTLQKEVSRSQRKP
jgi:hypothetical protein